MRNPHGTFLKINPRDFSLRKKKELRHVNCKKLFRFSLILICELPATLPQATSREKTKPINKEHIKEFGGRYASEVCRGRFGGESGTDLIYVSFHIDWTECSRDRRDTSMGQTGHAHGMVAIQMCPAELLFVYWFFFSQTSGTHRNVSKERRMFHKMICSAL